MELNLNFPQVDRVVVSLGDRATTEIPFESPLTETDLGELRWYLEVYGASYITDVDDDRAENIARNLDSWGRALFDAVFSDRHTFVSFNEFQRAEIPDRVLTVSAIHPQILSLPWELLTDPDGTHLLFETPRIAIRRCYPKTQQGIKPGKIAAKERLRLLFVISRPDGAGFIDPRLEAKATLEAFAEAKADPRIDVEFLRPATFENLQARLECRRQYRGCSPVDIVHFDGHGVFSKQGKEGEPTRREANSPVKKSQISANFGYLLFEDKDGQEDFVDAETLGKFLRQTKIGLMVLSACQSAAVGEEEEATGSVAAQLTQAGIPAVLAMSYSVLVVTARALFREFYQNLAYGERIGEALDNACQHLYLHRDRGQRQRGEERITLELYDWFLPTLYQSGQDAPMLADSPAPPVSRTGGDPLQLAGISHNLPQLQEAGFFGRSRELWFIERAFVGDTRRITLSGFGGQGKTYLAVEAGRWLCRTGMFEAACFVDYAAFQGTDAVGLAVATLRTVLLILDNLETLAPEPLDALLSVASQWSQAGGCRVLITTRSGELSHADYASEGTRKHLWRPLRGLGNKYDPEDALELFKQLMRLPPAPQLDPPDRKALINLFDKVKFHPLSIVLLARELKTRRIAEVGPNLERLLAQTSETDKDKSLIASLNLSLERLDPEARRHLPRLGVFQGGAFEDDLLKITGLGQSPQQSQIAQVLQLLMPLLRGEAALPEGVEVPAEIQQELQQLQELARNNPEMLEAMLAELPQTELAEGANEATWQNLRRQLEATGLVQAETLPGVNPPFLKFHPTLAPVLWRQLATEEREALLVRHRQAYYQLSGYLYQQDRQNPYAARAIVLRELPNLLFAVRNALDAADENAVDFVDSVNKFLDNFGLNKDRAELTRRAEALAEPGSRNWYLAQGNKGEQLLAAGRYGEAQQVFEAILQVLGEEPSYDRCLTLSRLGRCLRLQGQAARAAERYREGLQVAARLEPSDGVKRQTSNLQTDLANGLRDMGDFDGARQAYEASLAIYKEIGDARNEATVQFQLGTLEMLQGNLVEAEQRYREALATFQQFNEPASEAITWNQLGNLYQEVQQWEAAEQAYRQAARLLESQGNLTYAAQTWNQLAIVCKGSGKLEAAEAWYRKAIRGFKDGRDRINESKALSNLAALLKNDPNRLAEARQLAEEALSIDKTLDPAAAEIWKTYELLGIIARQQNDPETAREYRRAARQAKAAYAGTQYELQQFALLISAVVAAANGNTEVRQQIESAYSEVGDNVNPLGVAIRRILEGERDEETLCDSLNLADSMVVVEVLRQLKM